LPIGPLFAAITPIIEFNERQVMAIRRWLRMVARRLGVRRNPESLNDRSGVRNQCLIASEFGYFGNVNAAMIRNLNAGGAFIETRQRFNVGEVVQLKFPLHYLDPPVEVTAEIAWTGADGVGVKFNSVEHTIVAPQ
jgi:Tfp pilus assembly protein PilZ